MTAMIDVTVIGRIPAGFKKSDITKLANLAWKQGRGRGRVEMAVSVVDDRRIRALNRQYRGNPKVTDVLSFGQSPTKGAPSPKGAARQLGDLFVCLPQVRRQAKEIGRSVKEEFALMIVHGTLHLMGFDHETLAQERAMFGLQHDILLKAGYF